MVERRSFTLAARDLAIPRSTATEVVKQLESRLGARLLQRTTRHVAPTLDGEAYYRHCVKIVGDIEEGEAAFSGSKPTGVLHVDIHGTLARHFVLPGLPQFLERYPDLRLVLSEGDRLVDLVKEGIDCVLRVGELASSGMTMVDFRPTPTPVSVLYPQSRQLSLRVRVFIDWLIQEFAALSKAQGRLLTT